MAGNWRSGRRGGIVNLPKRQGQPTRPDDLTEAEAKFLGLGDCPGGTLGRNRHDALHGGGSRLGLDSEALTGVALLGVARITC